MLIAVRVQIASRSFGLGRMADHILINFTGAARRYRGAEILILVMYILPAATAAYLTDGLDDLAALLTTVTTGIILVGDFNVPGFKSHLSGDIIDQSAAAVIEFSEWIMVSQGSNLGSLLFLIFINGVSSHLFYPFLFYADDGKMYVRVMGENDCLLPQRNLDAFAQWSLLNKLSLLTSLNPK